MIGVKDKNLLESEQMDTTYENIHLFTVSCQNVFSREYKYMAQKDERHGFWVDFLGYHIMYVDSKITSTDKLKNNFSLELFSRSAFVPSNSSL